MKKNYWFLFMLLGIFSTNLMAFSGYVNVTNVKTKKELSYPYNRLKSMGYKMFYEKKSFGYAVYVGPFKSQKSLQHNYGRIKNSFTYAKMIPDESTSKKYSDSSAGLLFGLGLGYASSPATTDGTVTFNEQKSSGLNYLLYTGYNFENYFTLLFNYMNLTTSDLEFSNIYTSLNYRITAFESFVPYIGLSVGYSSLKWNTNPIEQSTPSSDNDSANIMYGAQLGFNYMLSKSFSIKVESSYLLLNHATTITQDTENTLKLEHKNMISILTALQYNF